MRPIRIAGLLSCAIAAACVKAAGSDTDTDTDVVVDTDVALPDPPCAAGGWAGADPSVAVHVREGASGTGSAADPMGDVEAAVAAAVASGSRQVFLWPGAYTAAIQLTPDAGDASYDGLQILGCSSSEVQISAPSTELQSVVLSRAAGVVITGVTLGGGKVGVWAHDLATVTLTDVVIQDASLMGLLAEGATEAGISTITVSNVAVAGTEPVDGEGGFGAVVRTGGLVTGADLRVSDSVGAGVVVDAGALVLDDLQVSGTTAYAIGDHAGFYGRGLHVQDGEITLGGDSVFTGNVDVGIWVARSSGEIADVHVSEVAAGLVPTSGTATGDGIVLSGRDPDPDHDLDPSLFTITLTGSSIETVDRAGIFADNVTVTLAGNTAISTGTDCTICFDADTIASGADVDTSVAVKIAAPLETNLVNVGVPSAE